MNPDELKQAWQNQASSQYPRVDPELLLQEVRRSQQYFAAMIFWRDVREVGVSLLMVPFWFYLGLKLALPWTWYLMVPALVWVAGYMLMDRVRQVPRQPEPAQPLHQYVASSLAQVDHQIWLLRNVFWWYLLPLALSMLPFVGQVAWQLHAKGGWLAVLVVIYCVAIAACLMGGLYRLNQNAVVSHLWPRHQELEALRRELQDETLDPDS